MEDDDFALFQLTTKPFHIALLIIVAFIFIAFIIMIILFSLFLSFTSFRILLPALDADLHFSRSFLLYFFSPFNVLDLTKI